MAFVHGTTTSDVLNGAERVTSGNDHVHGRDGTTRFAALAQKV
jgi:hypothetical protein